MTNKEIKNLIKWAKSIGAKSFKVDNFEIEFFSQQKPLVPMDLSPKNIVETLNDSMPPDSEMLFASVEDFNHEKEQLKS